jgi:hypothetical protein
MGRACGEGTQRMRWEEERIEAAPRPSLLRVADANNNSPVTKHCAFC